MIINLTFCDEFCVVSIIAKDKEIISCFNDSEMYSLLSKFCLIRIRGAFCICTLGVLQSCCQFLKIFNISV